MIAPEQNAKDLDEIPLHIRKKLDFKFVKHMDEVLELALTEMPGKDTWPIVGASFILLYKDQPEAGKIKAMLKFFDWCYKNGADQAKKLDYIPIPEKVYSLVEKMWSEKVKSNGKPVWP